MDYVHLHNHSNYSLLQGAFSVENLVRATGRSGQPAVALTDTNGLYGAIEFYRAAREAGIKPIIGAELVYRQEQCLCLAADREGYSNLCRLVTRRRLVGTPHGGGCAAGGEGMGGYDLADSVVAHSGGLFLLTACPWLLRRLHGRVPSGRLYGELRADGPHSFEVDCPSLSAPYGDESSKSTGPANRRQSISRDAIKEVANELDLPLAATVNVNFLNPADRSTHAVLCAIRENRHLEELGEERRMLAGEKSYRMSPEKIRGRLGGGETVLRAMQNTVRIAERCELELDLGVHHFPRYDAVPDGESACSYLRRVAEQGARDRYGELTPEVKRRLDRELQVIGDLGFCDYFLVVWDIVEFARREGIPHVGRGSAANSIVSYCLGISAVDPIKFDLYFERFLNEYRTDVPDIDMDFCWRRRDEVLEYVYDRYPAAHVAMVSTHSTLRARSAFRDVARVMGLPMDEINRYSSMLPHYNVSSIKEAMEKFPEMSEFPIRREPWATVLKHALHIDGYVRHLGIHLGGMVIGDRPLTRYSALENSTKGIVVTQYEMDNAEEVGLVKIDLLGQRSLSIVDEAARNVERNHGEHVDLYDLPDRDERTAQILRNGRTMGCFQIESPGMRQLLQMQQAESIMDVIQGLSLIRPGPSGSGMKEAFIRRSRGEEAVSYRTPKMKEALEGTYGVMLYQEDILKVAQVVAGFSLGEGDQLRKRITTDRSPEALGEMKGRFISGSVERGVDEGVARQIWHEIEGFAAYSYCKAHATTYGHISYQAAWLKARWPAEFIASVIANKAGFYDAGTYYRDARRFNVEILPPSVNSSGIECQPEPLGGRRNGAGAIRPGLDSVRSLQANTIRRIIEEREKRAFDTFEDFCARVTCQKKELENLVLGGAFDWTGHTRPGLMMKMELLLQGGGNDGSAEEGELFGQATPRDIVAESPPTYQVPSQPPFPLADRVRWELRILGMSHSGHPLEAWGNALRERGLTRSYQLSQRVGETVRFIGWLVTMRRAVTREKKYMKFLCLEDHHGVVEVVIFPDAYKEWGKELSGGGVYKVEGTVKEQHGAVSLVAERVRHLSG